MPPHDDVRTHHALVLIPDPYHFALSELATLLVIERLEVHGAGKVRISLQLHDVVLGAGGLHDVLRRSEIYRRRIQEALRNQRHAHKVREKWRHSGQSVPSDFV